MLGAVAQFERISGSPAGGGCQQGRQRVIELSEASVSGHSGERAEVCSLVQDRLAPWQDCEGGVLPLFYGEGSRAARDRAANMHPSSMVHTFYRISDAAANTFDSISPLERAGWCARVQPECRVHGQSFRGGWFIRVKPMHSVHGQSFRCSCCALWAYVWLPRVLGEDPDFFSAALPALSRACDFSDSDLPLSKQERHVYDYQALDHSAFLSLSS